MYQTWISYCRAGLKSNQKVVGYAHNICAIATIIAVGSLDRLFVIVSYGDHTWATLVITLLLWE